MNLNVTKVHIFVTVAATIYHQPVRQHKLL